MEVTIDGRKLTFEEPVTILDAARSAGVDIPIGICVLVGVGVGVRIYICIYIRIHICIGIRIHIRIGI